jgi:uncharacterized protein (TIGR02145 family)
MGWHVPTDYEWAYMLDKVNGDGTGDIFSSQASNGYATGTDAGRKLRSSSTFSSSMTDPGDGRWIEAVANGTDIYGFSIIPSGVRSEISAEFMGRGQNTSLASSTVRSVSNTIFREYGFGANGTYRHYQSRSYGLPVRCIKD